ncbi:MAG: hypothetical protein IPJ74_03235 [Saprospiraceae bacterium]|nr:hypothetical protein [Saprospiraceae bacterium]
MHHKLQELLRSLPEKELNRLDQFIFSSFFNENERLTALYSYIRSFAPHFSAPALSAELAFQHLFPNEEFDQDLLHKLNSQLFKLVENFIAHRQLDQDSAAKDIQLLRFYNRTLLPKHFTGTLNRLDKLQKQAQEQSLSYFQQQLELETIRAEFLSQNDTRTGDINLQALNQSLDAYFLLAKLMYLNSMLARQKIARVNYDFTWMEEILQYLERSEYRRIPAIEIYREILLLQINPGKKEYYIQLKELLSAHFQCFPTHELRSLYIYLENAVKHLFPVEAYFQELFELYKMQLDANILHENGYLPHTVFKNIVSVALSLQAFEWAAQFIESNRYKIIPEDYREDAYIQNLAGLHFFRGEYDRAQVLLLQSNPIDIYYKLSQKILLAEIYFEKRELEVLENFLNTFTKFIFDQQAKIASEKIASYRQFVNFLKKLLRILNATPETIEAFEKKTFQTDSSVLQSLKKLQKQIEKAPMFYSKKWLLNKIKEQL